MSNIKGFISVTHISNGMPISIAKVSIVVDSEQEKEKLKGKGVVTSGSLFNTKEEELETNIQPPAPVEENINL